MSEQLLFQPGKLGDIELENRFVLAPMTRISATEAGEVGPFMTDYYRGFGIGGFGAVITEGVYTDAVFSQGYKYQPGIVNTQQQQSWATLIKSVQATGAKVIMQVLCHNIIALTGLPAVLHLCSQEANKCRSIVESGPIHYLKK